MGLTVRTYLIDDGDVLRSVPRRIVDGLVFGRDALPDYAGTTQRVVEVILESENGKPAQIVKANGHYWCFDASGQIDDHLRETMAEAMDFALLRKIPASAKVVDIRPDIRKKEFQRKHRWDVSTEILDLIAADIWAKTERRARDVRSVQGTAPKKPPMTWEGKQALREIESSLGQIEFKLVGLSEPALKGLAFHAREVAETEIDHPELWRGVAAACERQREIKVRHRTGKGIWYAIVELLRYKNGHAVDFVKTVHEKCSSKAKAVAALQKLIIAIAPEIGDGIWLESRVLTDLEWSPDN